MKGFLKICLLTSLFFACTSEEGPSTGGEVTDNFDRKAMLTDWADGIIIPHYEAYASAVDSLEEHFVGFASDPDISKLINLRENWFDAYVHWQYVSMFEIGKAEQLQLRNFTNIFPADTSAIIENIENGNYNLQLPSTIDEQGFPAIDFLINGIRGDDQSIIDAYLDDPAMLEYLSDLITRMNELSDEVLEDWKSGYREVFINNVASSATGSVDKLVNDYVYWYERHLRAGKVGIPAGVFSGKTETQTVEAYYAGDLSKTLLLHALDAAQNFFNGVPEYNGYAGQSLSDYLNYLNTIKEGTDLSTLINDQFEAARNEIFQLNDDFRQQIEEDNISLLEAYDALQVNVILLKVDMMQALNVRVDYVDADGD